MLTFHAIFARKHDAKDGYALAVTFNDFGWIAIHKKYSAIVDAREGAQFRAEHAEVEVRRNHLVYARHEFPSPSQRARNANRKAVVEAQAIINARAVALREVAKAKANLDSIKPRTQAQEMALEQLSKSYQAVLDRKTRATAEALAKTQAKTASRAKGRARQLKQAEETLSTLPEES